MDHTRWLKTTKSRPKKKYYVRDCHGQVSLRHPMRERNGLELPEKKNGATLTKKKKQNEASRFRKKHGGGKANEKRRFSVGEWFVKGGAKTWLSKGEHWCECSGKAGTAWQVRHGPCLKTGQKTGITGNVNESDEALKRQKTPG